MIITETGHLLADTTSSTELANASAGTASPARVAADGSLANESEIVPTESDIEKLRAPPGPPLPPDARESVVAAQKLLEEEDRCAATATARKELLEAMRDAQLEASPETALPAPAPRQSKHAAKHYTGTRGSMYATGVVATGFLPIQGVDDTDDDSDFDEKDYVWDPVANDYVLSPEAAARADAKEAAEKANA